VCEWSGAKKIDLSWIQQQEKENGSENPDWTAQKRANLAAENVHDSSSIKTEAGDEDDELDPLNERGKYLPLKIINGHALSHCTDTVPLVWHEHLVDLDQVKDFLATSDYSGYKKAKELKEILWHSGEHSLGKNYTVSEPDDEQLTGIPDGPEEVYKSIYDKDTNVLDYLSCVYHHSHAVSTFLHVACHLTDEVGKLIDFDMKEQFYNIRDTLDETVDKISEFASDSTAEYCILQDQVAKGQENINNLSFQVNELQDDLKTVRWMFEALLQELGCGLDMYLFKIPICCLSDQMQQIQLLVHESSKPGNLKTSLGGLEIC
jgi:hypothetical protein